MEAHRLDREDQGVLQRDPLVRRGHPEEHPDVAQGVARAEDLQDDPSAVEVAGQFNGAAADDANAGGGFPGPEDGGPRREVLLLEHGAK